MEIHCNVSNCQLMKSPLISPCNQHWHKYCSLWHLVASTVVELKPTLSAITISYRVVIPLLVFLQLLAPGLAPSVPTWKNYVIIITVGKCFDSEKFFWLIVDWLSESCPTSFQILIYRHKITFKIVLAFPMVTNFILNEKVAKFYNKEASIISQMMPTLLYWQCQH